MSGLRRTSSTNFLASQIEASEVDQLSRSTQPFTQHHEPARMQGIPIEETSSNHPSLTGIRAEIINHSPEFATLSNSLVASSSADHGSSSFIQGKHTASLSDTAESHSKNARPITIVKNARAKFAAFDADVEKLDSEMLHSLQKEVRSLNKIAARFLGQHDGNEELILNIEDHDDQIENTFKNAGKGTYDHEYQSNMLAHLRSALDSSSGVIEDPSFEQAYYEGKRHESSQVDDHRVEHHEAALPIHRFHIRNPVTQNNAALEDGSWGQLVDPGHTPSIQSSSPGSSDSGHTDEELNELGGMTGNL